MIKRLLVMLIAICFTATSQAAMISTLPDRSALLGLVRHAHQQCEQHVVRDERRAAVGHERQGHAGQGQQPDHAGDDDERLERDERGQTDDEQAAERVGRAASRAQ